MNLSKKTQITSHNRTYTPVDDFEHWNPTIAYTCTDADFEPRARARLFKMWVYKNKSVIHVHLLPVYKDIVDWCDILYKQLIYTELKKTELYFTVVTCSQYLLV